ncbi:hypothetical protein AAEH72_05890 [Shewanella xiamenensis]|uniref:hypothetical protein n=1 Tax=Shewanella xiamenensis TaxID=332186 RepID=UPI00313D49EE
MDSNISNEVVEYKKKVKKARRDAEVITLREWYDSTESHCEDIKCYMQKYKQLGRLGKELHLRNVPRITERYGDSVSVLVEATYKREVLDFAAPMCAALCTKNR